MGWNDVKIQRTGTVLGEPSDSLAKFYFVHSYYVDCNDSYAIAGITKYDKDFVSAFQVDNIIGVQFHPEKSHKYGMNLFRNFAKKIL